jgi:hypothetical protein
MLDEELIMLKLIILLLTLTNKSIYVRYRTELHELIT